MIVEGVLDIVEEDDGRSRSICTDPQDVGRIGQSGVDINRDVVQHADTAIHRSMDILTNVHLVHMECQICDGRQASELDLVE